MSIKGKFYVYGTSKSFYILEVTTKIACINLQAYEIHTFSHEFWNECCKTGLIKEYLPLRDTKMAVMAFIQENYMNPLFS